MDHQVPEVVFPSLSEPQMGPRTWLVASFVFAAIVATFLTVPMGVASFAWLILTGGIFLDLNRLAHARWMLAGVLLDIALVLVLQFQRGAVQTAVARTLSEVQQLHIVASLGAVLLYLPAIALGRKIFRNSQTPEGKRDLHRNVGRVAYLLRTLGYFLMFSMLSHVRG